MEASQRVHLCPRSGRHRARTSNPDLEGTNRLGLEDVNGKPIIAGS